MIHVSMMSERFLLLESQLTTLSSSACCQSELKTSIFGLSQTSAEYDNMCPSYIVSFSVLCEKTFLAVKRFSPLAMPCKGHFVQLCWTRVPWDISVIQEVVVSIIMGFEKHHIDGSGHFLYNDNFMKNYLVRFGRPE